MVGEWTIPKPPSAARLAQLPGLLREGSPQLVSRRAVSLAVAGVQGEHGCAQMDIAVNPVAEKAFCQWLYEVRGWSTL